MKKILAIALALVMIMSLAVFATAAETTLPDSDGTGWWVNHTEGIPVTEEGFTVTFTSTTYADATGNWHGPLAVVYGADEAKVNGAGYTEYWVQRVDQYGFCVAAGYYGVDLNRWSPEADLAAAGITVSSVDSRTDGWANFLSDLKAGVECTVTGKLEDGKVVLTFEANGIYSTTILTVDTTKTTYISLFAELATLTNIVVTTPDAATEPVAVADGKYVIACGDLTFAALAEDAGYGYPVAGSASALADTDYITITNVADGQFTMQDCYGRYIWMKGTYNSFNVSADMPTEGYLWVLEETEGGLMLKNVEKEKYLAYSEQYTSWGCYAEVTANFVLTVTAAATEEPAPTTIQGCLKYADADYWPATAGDCAFEYTGPGTYTISLENITATYGCGLDVASMFYIEFANGYETMKDLKVSEMTIVVDGEPIAVNLDYIWTYESLGTDYLPTGAYCIEIYNIFGYSGSGMGAAIDPNIFADESIVITFTLTDPNAPVDPNPNQPTGDIVTIVLAFFAISGMGLTAVASKKR